MLTRALQASLFAVLLASSGCSPRPRTQITVVVEAADGRTRERIERLRVEVSSVRLGSRVFHRASPVLSDAGLSNQLYRAAFIPEDPSVRDTLDVVSVLTFARAGGGSEPVEQRAVVAFEEGRTILLRMSMSAACVGVSCPPMETCSGRGTCESIYRVADEQGSPPRPRDGGAPLDAAGALDAADALDVGGAFDAAVPPEATVGTEVRDGGDEDLGPTPPDGRSGDCGTRCVDFVNDPENCGGPGITCEGRTACREGRCAPDEVQALRVALAAGRGCALMSDGSLRCWGASDCSEPGIFRSGRDVSRPSRVLGVRGATHLAVSRSGMCWIIDHTVHCCGEIGIGSLDGFVGADDVVGGDVFGCALRGGLAYCGGSNRAGQCGTGSTDDYIVPPEAVRLPVGRVSEIVAGHNNACAIVEGAAYCWGQNSGGQLGVDLTATSCPVERGSDGCASPLRVPGLVDVRAIAINGYETGGAAALTAPNSVWTWGSGPALGWGDGSVQRVTTSAQYPLTATVRAIARGERHTCVMLEGGAVHCWGANDAGQLGNDAARDAVLPRFPLPGAFAADGVTQVVANDARTCVVRAGDVLCAGNNTDGQLGVGDPDAGAVFHPRPLAW